MGPVFAASSPDVADVCAFLASDDSQYITGASVEVTGITYHLGKNSVWKATSDPTLVLHQVGFSLADRWWITGTKVFKFNSSDCQHVYNSVNCPLLHFLPPQAARINFTLRRGICKRGWWPRFPMSWNKATKQNVMWKFKSQTRKITLKWFYFKSLVNFLQYFRSTQTERTTRGAISEAASASNPSGLETTTYNLGQEKGKIVIITVTTWKNGGICCKKETLKTSGTIKLEEIVCSLKNKIQW